MQTNREQQIIKRIADQYGTVIDLTKTPGVMIEVLREFGPTILKDLGEDNGGGGGGTGGVSSGPTVSSIAIAGPGSGSVVIEDLMRVILELRQEIIKLSERVAPGR